MGENGVKKETPMSTINFSPSPQDLTSQVHHLPCSIKFTGPSHVSHYFNPKSTGFEVDGLPIEEAYFRGRKLDGVTVPLPDAYSGYILGKQKSGSVEDSHGGENSWETLAKCGNMTFWNHDSLPSKDDASLRLFHLFAVAKALHEPVKVEDLPSIK